jgi:hypothetical protein
MKTVPFLEKKINLNFEAMWVSLGNTITDLIIHLSPVNRLLSKSLKAIC